MTMKYDDLKDSLSRLTYLFCEADMDHSTGAHDALFDSLGEAAAEARQLADDIRTVLINISLAQKHRGDHDRQGSPLLLEGLAGDHDGEKKQDMNSALTTGQPGQHYHIRVDVALAAVRALPLDAMPTEAEGRAYAASLMAIAKCTVEVAAFVAAHGTGTGDADLDHQIRTALSTLDSREAAGPPHNEPTYFCFTNAKDNQIYRSQNWGKR